MRHKTRDHLLDGKNGVATVHHVTGNVDHTLKNLAPSHWIKTPSRAPSYQEALISRSSPRTERSRGWVVLSVAVIGALLFYLADRDNVPVIAPCMDMIAAFVYGWIPNLSRFPGVNPMWISSAIIGAGILLVCLPIAQPRRVPRSYRC
jgi:hypothetical protein